MTISRKLDACRAAVALALAAAPALADEASLYADPPPPDAVFMRVLSQSTVPPMGVSFGGQDLPYDASQSDTYIAISAAALSGVTAGNHYSVLQDANDVTVIEEPTRETASKVHLIVVNTANEPVRLIVAGRDMEVVGAVPAGHSASRAVNPVSVALAVQRVADGATLGQFDVTLSRGQNLTFVAEADSARVIENAFGPVLTLN